MCNNGISNKQNNEEDKRGRCPFVPCEKILPAILCNAIVRKGKIRPFPDVNVPDHQDIMETLHLNYLTAGARIPFPYLRFKIIHKFLLAERTACPG